MLQGWPQRLCPPLETRRAEATVQARSRESPRPGGQGRLHAEPGLQQGGQTDPGPACSSHQGHEGGVGVNEMMNSARRLQMGHPSRPRAPGVRRPCWSPGGLGRWRAVRGLQLGHAVEPPLQTTSGQGCRQGDVCVFRKMGMLIGDALERVFENLALKYRWG